MRVCLNCHRPVDANDGYYEIKRIPSGDLWTLCDIDCLIAFVRGGDAE